MSKSVVIIAPFWRLRNHVGIYRIERFLRWLQSADYRAIIISAGIADEETEHPWGMEICVRDPVGLYWPSVAGGDSPSPRKPNRFRRILASWVFQPDLGVLWARRAIANPNVLRRIGRNIEFVLSSSPPESVHVASWLLARQLNSPLLIDMRDGWLDEPLRSALTQSPIRRLTEGFLERKILRSARKVFVTSDVWKDLLIARKVIDADRIEVITNAYPISVPNAHTEPPIDFDKRLTLLHAGQFGMSRDCQDPALLFRPLLIAAESSEIKGTIRLLGKMSPNDLATIGTYQEQFQRHDWAIEVLPPVDRTAAIQLINESSGLLLLCASHAAIPSKLFEYIVAKRPIFAVTGRQSAVWRICENLPQAYLRAIDEPSDPTPAVTRFLSSASLTHPEFATPEQFSEQSLSIRFLDIIQNLDAKAPPP